MQSESIGVLAASGFGAAYRSIPERIDSARHLTASSRPRASQPGRSRPPGRAFVGHAVERRKKFIARLSCFFLRYARGDDRHRREARRSSPPDTARPGRRCLAASFPDGERLGGPHSPPSRRAHARVSVALAPRPQNRPQGGALCFRESIFDFTAHRLTRLSPVAPQKRDAMNEPVPSVPRKARTGTALDGIERGTRASALPAHGFPSLARFPAKRRSAAFSAESRHTQIFHPNLAGAEGRSEGRVIRGRFPSDIRRIFFFVAV